MAEDYNAASNNEEPEETSENSLYTPFKQPEDTEAPLTSASDEQPPDSETPPEVSDLARVGITTGDQKVTISTSVQEFEDFKLSFKALMESFTRLMESTGLDVGKDETVAQLGLLTAEVQQLKDEVQSEQEKLRREMTPRDDFDKFKSETEENEAQAKEDYVRRAEFDKFRQAVRDAI